MNEMKKIVPLISAGGFPFHGGYTYEQAQERDGN